MSIGKCHTVAFSKISEGNKRSPLTSGLLGWGYVKGRFIQSLSSHRLKVRRWSLWAGPDGQTLMWQA